MELLLTSFPYFLDLTEDILRSSEALKRRKTQVSRKQLVKEYYVKG